MQKRWKAIEFLAPICQKQNQHKKPPALHTKVPYFPPIANRKSRNESISKPEHTKQ